MTRTVGPFERRRPTDQSIETDAVHVWRIAIGDGNTDAFWPLLSAEEQARARRLVRDSDARAYIVAHGALRQILGGYEGVSPESLAFTLGEFGKPSLAATAHRPPLTTHNLSHSGDLALVAVGRLCAVGVDVERWDRQIEHFELAEHCFSPAERSALRTLASDAERTAAGFFNAWTRKEAYLKATGAGITNGLHHFDVSLIPEAPSELFADRSDASARERWQMFALDVGRDYAAAVVVGQHVRAIRLFDLDLGPA